jgi:Flp pilus assembly pilin Flp
MKLTAFEKMMQDNSGQGIVEYSLILGFVAVVAIASLQVLGNRVASAGSINLGNSASVIP